MKHTIFWNLVGRLTSILEGFMEFSSGIGSKRNCTVLNKLLESCIFIDGSAWNGNQARSRGSFDPMDYVACANLYVIMKLLVVRFRWPRKGECFKLCLSMEQAKRCRRQSGCRVYAVLCIWIVKWYEATLVHIDDIYNPETVKV